MFNRIAALFLCFAVSHPAFADYPVEVQVQETRIQVEIGQKPYELEAKLFLPQDGKAQHPLAVMTHGRNGPTPNRNPREIHGYSAFNRALAAQGILVMHLVRRGYGNSDGPDGEYLSSAEESGLEGAKDVRAAVAYMRKQSGVIPDRIVVIGQSQGGWVALASSTLEMEGVLGTVNISGATNFTRAQGYSIRSREVEDQLKNAAAFYGKDARRPVMWIYAANDNHPEASVREWFEAFQQAGGKGKLFITEPYQKNGHAVIGTPSYFMGELMAYLTEIKLLQH